MNPIRHLRGAIFALLILIASAARSDTYVLDWWGTVVAHYCWPADHDVVIPVPGTLLPPDGYKLETPYPRTTPAPTPIKTPAPSIKPAGTPKPA